ncbi:hypothetical protein C4J81_09325 [Deltaproteobacteria bacterium Smac51]|nr:hypothetical protein C4J81_09325 [Deltaproteobacteria bacterium Smac51]
MSTGIGVLCSGPGLELYALIQAVHDGRLPATIRLVICDSQNSDVLTLARSNGLQAAFVPRGAFHANIDGYERRLLEMMREAQVEMVVLAGFARELGSVLNDAYPGQIVGRDLCPVRLVSELESVLRKKLFTVVG